MGWGFGDLARGGVIDRRGRGETMRVGRRVVGVIGAEQARGSGWIGQSRCSLRQRRHGQMSQDVNHGVLTMDSRWGGEECLR